MSTRRSRRIAPPGRGGSRTHLTWSPDGRFFAVVDGGYGRDAMPLWLFRDGGGGSFAVTDGTTKVLSPRFSRDGRQLYYVSNRDGSMDLWRQRLASDGEPEDAAQPLTVGVGMRSATFSPDGSKLAYSKGRLVSNVWRVPILESRPATWADAEQLTFDQARLEHFDVSPDGERLLFNSDRSGNMDLWMMPIESGEMIPLTSGSDLDWHPRWSPDGEDVAFYSSRTGRREIFVMRLGGGPAVQLTSSESDDTEFFFPEWSPDGNEIAFTARRARVAIHAVPRDGGATRFVFESESREDLHPAWSRDGRWLMFAANQSLWRVPAEGGEPERLTEGGVDSWPIPSRDGKQVFFPGFGERLGNIWAFALEDQSERPMADLKGRYGSLQTQFVTDGRYLYFGWAEDLGDIWVMDVVAE